MKHCFAALLALLLASPWAHAQATLSPRKLIDHLGVDIRQSLENPKADKTPEALERAVAEQITALIRSSEGHLSLTETDTRGRTPLMLAASNGYAQVVQALLADPSVKLRINQPDEGGATAWMLANFAPTLTLVACEPGTLTAERYVLLPPYLQRMGALLKTKGAAIVSVIQMLEAAGAETDAEAAKRLWLARCPNAAPELREALPKGALMRTLVNEAVARQRDFNKMAHESTKDIPVKPPEGMRFIHSKDPSGGRGSSPLLNYSQRSCQNMPRPQLPSVKWSGTILIRATVATRAGIAEAVDFEILEPKDVDARVADSFRGMLLRALAGYQCDGDVVFEQDFLFYIKD